MRPKCKDSKSGSFPERALVRCASGLRLFAYWGVICLNYLPYMLLDLELLCREEDIEVQAEDVAILRQVLETISGCEPTDAARDVFMEILERRGFWHRAKTGPAAAGKTTFLPSSTGAGKMGILSMRCGTCLAIGCRQIRAFSNPFIRA